MNKIITLFLFFICSQGAYAVDQKDLIHLQQAIDSNLSKIYVISNGTKNVPSLQSLSQIEGIKASECRQVTSGTVLCYIRQTVDDCWTKHLVIVASKLQVEKLISSSSFDNSGINTASYIRLPTPLMLCGSLLNPAE